MTHTPGPWTHYDDCHDTTRRHEIVARGKTIARIYCTRGDEEADRANARLIAAAPVMLDAMVYALPVLDLAAKKNFPGAINSADVVRAAIKKARGQ